MKIRIDNFRDRLASIVSTLVHEDVFFWDGETRVLGNIFEVNDIYDAMLGDPVMGKKTHKTSESGTRAGVIRRWQMALKDNLVPEEYLNYINQIYPEARQALRASQSEFDAFIGNRSFVRREWELAMRHLAKNRYDLAKLAKRYYFDVDDTQRGDFPYREFPLVARRDWILDKPFLLNGSANYSLPEYRTVTAPKPPILDGLNITALTLKQSVTLRNRLRRTGRPFWNGATYRVLDIVRQGPNLHFKFGNSTYFEYINSCEARAIEFARAALRNDGDLADWPLPIRVSPSDVFSFLGRATFPGVNCITIIRNYSEPNVVIGSHHDAYLVHFRDETVMEAQNCVHVVPAGGHQPLSDDLLDPDSIQISKTVAREFLEELRGYKELDEHNESKQEILEMHAEYQKFFFPLNNQAPIAKIFLLGAGIDPVTTKVEILCAIVVDWKAARARIRDIELLPNYEGKLKRIRLSPSVEDRKKQLRDEADGFIHAPWGTPLAALPAGAACFQLAAEHYETLIE